jgi:hypothetical protein
MRTPILRERREMVRSADFRRCALSLLNAISQTARLGSNSSVPSLPEQAAPFRDEPRKSAAGVVIYAVAV